jgi:hypothetical protein
VVTAPIQRGSSSATSALTPADSGLGRIPSIVVVSVPG